MKEIFVDPETGWIVTQEASRKRWQAGEVIEETITHPQTGETHHRSRVTRFQESVAEWLQEIGRHRAAMEEVNRVRKQRLHELYPELAAAAEVPAGELGKIKLRFAEAFSLWGISLSEESIVERRRGEIVRAGWAISYLFGCDEKGEYLDYYASHRMTNDRHVRIHADGTSQGLPAILDLRAGSENPDEDARLRQEYFAKNRAVAEMLRNKGFGQGEHEPPRA